MAKSRKGRERKMERARACVCVCVLYIICGFWDLVNTLNGRSINWKKDQRREKNAMNIFYMQRLITSMGSACKNLIREQNTENENSNNGKNETEINANCLEPCILRFSLSLSLSNGHTQTLFIHMSYAALQRISEFSYVKWTTVFNETFFCEQNDIHEKL